MTASTQTDWINVESGDLPIGQSVLLKNEPTGVIEPGYFDWMQGVPFPVAWSVSPTGTGRFKATHFQHLPTA